MANKFFDKLIGGNKSPTTETEVESVKCLDFRKANFCELMARNMFSKILHEAADRAILPKEIDKSDYYLTVYDNYAPYKVGLISWVTKALVEQELLYLKKSKVNGFDNVYVFEKVLENEAKNSSGRIKSDILELDFRKFWQMELICLMFELIQGILTATSKNITVANALILKIYKLSELIENSSNDEALRIQLKQLNSSIRNGNAGFVDSQSSIEFPMVDTKPNSEAVDFVFSMIANITGLPKSWIFGDIVSGLGSQESGDTQSLNRAIKYYYFSILHGVLYAVYNTTFDYKALVDDINSLVSMFSFIETTSLLTPEGKLKFMINNTGFDEEDINQEAFSIKTTAPTPTNPTNPTNGDLTDETSDSE